MENNITVFCHKPVNSKQLVYSLTKDFLGHAAFKWSNTPCMCKTSGILSSITVKYNLTTIVIMQDIAW